MQEVSGSSPLISIELRSNRISEKDVFPWLGDRPIRDGRLITYNPDPVQLVSSSGKDLKQLLQWLQEFPVLSMEDLEVEVNISAVQTSEASHDRSQTISLEQVIADLQLDEYDISPASGDKVTA